MWAQVVAVAVGGAVGAVGRLLVTRASAIYIGAGFPYGTLIVNVLGSFILGVVAGLSFTRAGVPMVVRLSLGVGFCGAFTTFSTFAVDTLNQRSLGLGLLNVVLNNVVSIAAAGVGLYLASTVRPEGS